MWFTFNKKVSKYIHYEWSQYILYNMFISFFCGATIENCTIPLYWTFLQEDSINWLISCIKMISLYIQWSMECITFLYSMYERYWHSLSSLAYYSFRLYLKHNLHVHKNLWSLNFICIIFFFIIFFVGKVRERERTRISKRI